MQTPTPSQPLPLPMDEASTQRGRHIGFARASYRGRLIGLTLGFFTLACALYQQQAPVGFWIGPVLHGFLWPHIGWWAAKQADDPRAAERRNMLSGALARRLQGHAFLHPKKEHAWSLISNSR